MTDHERSDDRGEGAPSHGGERSGPGLGGSPTAAGTGADADEAAREARADPEVRALVEELRRDDPDPETIRADPTTAAEEVGDGTDA